MNITTKISEKTINDLSSLKGTKVSKFGCSFVKNQTSKSYAKVLDVRIFNSIEYGDFYIIAKLKKSGGTLSLVKNYLNNEEIPEFKEDMCCYCGNKKVFYLTKHIKSGELSIKCLDCVGGSSPSVERIEKEINNILFKNEPCFNYYSLEDYLSYCCYIYDKDKILKLDKTNEENTQSKAWNTMTGDIFKNLKPTIPSKFNQKAKEIINFFNNKEEDFLKNKKEFNISLILLIKKEYIKYKDINLAIYLLKIYEDTNKFKNSNFIGNIEDIFEDSVTLISSTHRETQYGSSFINNFDYNGNLLTWFSCNKSFEPHELGKKFYIKGIIKGHKEFQGNKYTQLTRCNIIM